MYLVNGSAEVGGENYFLQQNQVGWLDKGTDDSKSELQITAGKEGCQLVVYAGQPQQANIISQGPFIGDTREDMVRLYKAFHQGTMKHISTLPESQLINY